MSQYALLIVGVQKGLLAARPYNESQTLENIKKILASARANGAEVVFARHEDQDLLVKGTPGWEISEQVAPLPTETLIDKQHASSFYQTGLAALLKERGVKKIILVGLRTEYCVDATCKSAFENDFEVIVPQDSNTTFDNAYLTAESICGFFNYTIWDHRFASVLSPERTLALLAEK